MTKAGYCLRYDGSTSSSGFLIRAIGEKERDEGSLWREVKGQKTCVSTSVDVVESERANCQRIIKSR